MRVVASPRVQTPSRPDNPRIDLRSLWRKLPRVAGYAFLFLLVTILLVYPAGMLVVGAFRSGPPGSAATFTFANIEAFFSSAVIWVAIGHSAFLATVTTIVGMVLALALAYMAQRTNALFRTLITPAMVLTFATPPLFYALGYSLLANQYSGLLNIAVERLRGVQSPIINIESWFGIVLVMSLRSTAFIYLFVAGPVAALNRNHEDASYTSGAGFLKTMLKINVGILMPAITGAAILAFLAGVQTFDTALIIAEPAGIRVIATQVFNLLLGKSPPEYGTASALSLFLFVIVLGMVFAQARVLGTRLFTTREGKSVSADRRDLRFGRYVAGTLIMTYFVVSLVLPMGALVTSSFQPFPGVFGNWTVVHYVRAFSEPDIWDAIRTTLILSVSVGAVAMALSVSIALAMRKAPPGAATYLRLSVLLPRAMPGVVLALAITWAYVSLPGLRLIYGTIWIMFLALIVVVIPFTLQAAQSALVQISADLEEAALVAGASHLRMVATVLVPLIAPTFFYGWFIAAVIVAGTLDIPLLLSSPGLATISQKIYEMNFSGSIGSAAALLVSLLTFLSLLALCGALTKRMIFPRVPV